MKYIDGVRIYSNTQFLYLSSVCYIAINYKFWYIIYIDIEREAEPQHKHLKNTTFYSVLNSTYARYQKSGIIW